MDAVKRMRLGPFSSVKNAMQGIRSILGPRSTSNVWFVPRRPHSKRPAKHAFFARLYLAEPLTTIRMIIVIMIPLVLSASLVVDRAASRTVAALAAPSHRSTYVLLNHSSMLENPRDVSTYMK